MIHSFFGKSMDKDRKKWICIKNWCNKNHRTITVITSIVTIILAIMGLLIGKNINIVLNDIRENITARQTCYINETGHIVSCIYGEGQATIVELP
jgi:hypothetical protein